MKAAILALSLAAAPSLALADDCADRFAEILTGSQDRAMIRGRLITQTRGQPTVVNDFSQQAWDHYLYAPVDPADAPYVLTWDGVAYQSADGDAPWIKAYEFDKQETRAAGIAMVEGQAATIRNAACGTDTIDGVTYDTLEADMTNETSFRYDIRSKYWIAPDDDGFIARATTVMRAENFESLVTQTWERAPGLDLPKPH